MKFWQKIYFFSLILFIMTFNISGVLLIEKIFNESLKDEIQTGLNEHLGVVSTVNLNEKVYDTLKKYSRHTLSDEEIIYNLISSYSFENDFKNKKIALEILNFNNDILYSDVKFDMPKNRMELEVIENNLRKYIIRDIGDTPYLFISSKFGETSKYVFTFIKDISLVYNNRKNFYLFFIKLDIIISIVFIVFMYIISKHITKPISKIIEATKKITDGDFSRKIEVNSNDEFGILSNHFNIMSRVIENKILELQTVNDAKQRFINNLTHELKTPLTSIIGYADFLRKTKFDEVTYLEGLDHIYREGKRLERLSKQLMNLILLKKENLQFEKISLKITINEAIDILMPKINYKHIEIVFNNEDFNIMQEQDLIIVLFLNLLDNAIKASEYNSKIQITINKKEQIIKIQDFGIGMTKEHSDKIFEPFYMVDTSRSKNDSAGLGLAICKEIMNMHNISFSIESFLDEGTSIFLYFNEK